MNRCLHDRTLWLLSEGEASREDRAHVVSCAACTARLQRLEEDVRRLTWVLSAPPPPQVAQARLWPVRGQWLTASATLTVLLVVVWVGLWWQQPSPPALPTEAHQESVWPFIEGISAALFSSVDSGVIGTTEEVGDLDDLHAALDWDWPCEVPEVLGKVACEDDAFVLFIGGQ
jgi:hypothetical protein